MDYNTPIAQRRSLLIVVFCFIPYSAEKKNASTVPFQIDLSHCAYLIVCVGQWAVDGKGLGSRVESGQQTVGAWAVEEGGVGSGQWELEWVVALTHSPLPTPHSPLPKAHSPKKRHV